MKTPSDEKDLNENKIESAKKRDIPMKKSLFLPIS